MPWWGWALLAWVSLALVLGVVLGRMIRTAERMESRDRWRQQDSPHDRQAS